MRERERLRCVWCHKLRGLSRLVAVGIVSDPGGAVPVCARCWAVTWGELLDHVGEALDPCPGCGSYALDESVFRVAECDCGDHWEVASIDCGDCGHAWYSVVKDRPRLNPN